MGQSMVAIIQADCTGCDLCIPHCPFEALLPLTSNPEGRQHKKRPVVVLASQCVGCLSCIGSCPTKALHEIVIPLFHCILPCSFQASIQKPNPYLDGDEKVLVGPRQV